MANNASPHWILGVVLCALGSTCSSAGLILQKHSHNVGETAKPLYSRWRWWCGFVMAVVLAGVLESVALLLAPLSLISPIFGLSIAANSIISIVCLGERMTQRGVWATTLIIVGTSLTSAFGSHDSANRTAEEIFMTLTSGTSAGYFFVIFGICSMCWALLRSIRGQRQHAWLDSLLFANFAGCVGGNQTLFLKCTMDVMATAHGLEWAALASFASLTFVLGVGQLAILNQGLAQHAAVSYLATYKSLLTVYGCIAGGVVFGEFEKFAMMQWVAFPVSVFIVICGLLVLPEGHDAGTDKDSDDETESNEQHESCKVSMDGTDFENSKEWNELEPLSLGG